MVRTCLCAAVVMTILASNGLADIGLSPIYKKVMEVVNSTELSKEQKIARLKELAGAEETRMIALARLDVLDSSEAMRSAAAVFRAEESSRELKLRMGHFLLGYNRPERKGFPEGFVKEFAECLVGLVLDGGEKEFCRKLPEFPLTAVGEYAYLASDFDGYMGIDFASLKDARVVPVLIRCLDAPDNVYPKDQGDCIRGTPGELTGRNTARQQIPVALARLDAVQAVEPLRRVLRKHHDWYLRDNAAYTLARLEAPADHAKLVTELLAGKAVDAQGRPDRAKDRYHHLYAFGRGLLQRGDDGGIEFMAFKYSTYNSSDGLSETAYMLEQRINDLKDTRSPKLEGFFKRAFVHERVLGLLMLDEKKVKVYDEGHTVYDFAKAAPRIEEIFDRLCQIIENNRLTSLRPTIEQIAKHSASETLRHRAERCAARLEK